MPQPNQLACRTLLVLALAAACPRAWAAEPAQAKPQATTPPAPDAKTPPAPNAKTPAKGDAAFKACSQRADLLFVRKCLQACMIDSKTNTRVMQSSVQRDECQLKCGSQPEKLAFLQSCMTRAGYPDYRPKPAK
jgi:hypothetical protein